jgi:hypothetical protein
VYLVILLFSLLHLFTSANHDSWTGTFNTRKKMSKGNDSLLFSFSLCGLWMGGSVFRDPAGREF